MNLDNSKPTELCQLVPNVFKLGFQVDNCDQLTKPRVNYPNLKTDEPVCPDGQLQCGNGECIDKILFCDAKPDCADG